MTPKPNVNFCETVVSKNRIDFIKFHSQLLHKVLNGSNTNKLNVASHETKPKEASNLISIDNSEISAKTKCSRIPKYLTKMQVIKEPNSNTNCLKLPEMQGRRVLVAKRRSVKNNSRLEKGEELKHSNGNQNILEEINMALQANKNIVQPTQLKQINIAVQNNPSDYHNKIVSEIKVILEKDKENTKQNYDKILQLFSTLEKQLLIGSKK